MTPSSASGAMPRLVLRSPAPLAGTVLPLVDEVQVLGRDSSNQLQVDVPGVSHQHAVLRRSGDQTIVEDLNSGTLVNGSRVQGPQVLQSGDVVGFGSVEAKYEEAGSARPEVQTQTHTTQSHSARFDVEDQRAGAISNVGRDQYNEYIHQVAVERESFLREIAAARTRARWLIWIGFLLFLAGGSVYAWVIVRYVVQVNNLSSPEAPPQTLPKIFGPDINGVPIGAIGFAAAGIGLVLMIVGILLHAVATARRRRVAAERPLPPPPPTWPPRIG
ncbi:FHA domain-containing protein [Streptomyces sp. NRAIS4]